MRRRYRQQYESPPTPEVEAPAPVAAPRPVEVAKPPPPPPVIIDPVVAARATYDELAALVKQAKRDTPHWQWLMSQKQKAFTRWHSLARAKQ